MPEARSAPEGTETPDVTSEASEGVPALDTDALADGDELAALSELRRFLALGLANTAPYARDRASRELRQIVRRQEELRATVPPTPPAAVEASPADVFADRSRLVTAAAALGIDGQAAIRLAVEVFATPPNCPKHLELSWADKARRSLR